jgi:hypothetical protein
MNHCQVFDELSRLPESKQAQFDKLVLHLSEIIPDFNYSLFALYFVNNQLKESEWWILDAGEVFERYDTWAKEWVSYSAKVELDAHSAPIESETHSAQIE